MTKKHSTKRALLGSAISLLLCFAMLVGTTFAWFTDNVTSTGNRIIAGDLEIDLLMDKGDGAGYVSISGDDGDIFNEAKGNNGFNWEPGKTEIVYLAVRNTGSLALKYNLILDIEDKGLVGSLEYAIIDGAKSGTLTETDWATLKGRTDAQTGDIAAGKFVAAPNGQLDAIALTGEADETDYFALAVHMKEEAGNEYEKQGIEIDVLLTATQVEAEEDSFGPDYDKDALFAKGDDVYVNNETNEYVVLSTKGLSSVAALASTDDSITSVTYVTDAGEVEVPVVRDAAALDSAIVADNDIVVIANGNYTVDTAKNTTVTIVGNGENTMLSIESEGEHNTDYGFDGSTVVFENLTFNVNGYLNGYARMNATYNNCIINGTYTLNGKSVFNNCTFNKTGDDYCVWTWGAPTAEFNNCTFNTDGKAILLYGGANTVLKLTGCKFNDSGVISGKAAIEVGSDWATDTKEIILTNCTVSGFDVTEQKSLTWGGDNLGTNVWGNKNLLPADRLNVVIDGADVY